jgi:hypothetical protein
MTFLAPTKVSLTEDTTTIVVESDIHEDYVEEENENPSMAKSFL